MNKKQLSHSAKLESVDDTIEALRRLAIVLKQQLRDVLAELRRLERDRRD